MIASISEFVEHFEQFTDHRVRGWMFLGNLYSPISTILLYLFIVMYAAPAFMRNRPAFKLKRAILIYNIIQITSCLTIFLAILFNGWSDGSYPLTCVNNEYSDDGRPGRFTVIFWWNLIIKMLDFVETVFFVLRKKQNQVSFLHLYHHISTYMFMWIGAKFVPGIMASMLIMLNSFIHVLMYSYYLISTFGPEIQKRIIKYKKLLTILQMVQFVIILLYTGQLILPHCQHLPNAKNLIYVFFPNVVLIFYLFYDFFTKAYKKKNKSQ